MPVLAAIASPRVTVALAFLASAAATVLLILLRPSLRVRVLRRHIRVETYFLGALLGPLLIFSAGALTYEHAKLGILYAMKELKILP